MKQKIFTLFLALATSVGTIFAEKVQIGELYYNLDDENKTAEVTYDNGGYNKYVGLTYAEIPASVEYDEQAYYVTSIGDNAFYACHTLTDVTIPNSITEIGDFAFDFCNNLSNLVIPNSVTKIGKSGGATFNQCTSLISVVIPNSVTFICSTSFSHCSNLTHLTIGSGVTNIGFSAFHLCTNLTSITCKAVTPPELGSSVFYNVDKSIPVYVPAISLEAYENWGGFTNILPMDECTISGTCGADGDNLSWELSCDGVLTINGTGEMVNTSSSPWSEYKEYLKSVIVAPGVTRIGNYAFCALTNLTSAYIPSSVTSIGTSAFANCPALESIIVSSGNTVYDSRDNCNAIIETATTTLVSGCKNTIIPNSVTSIGETAFAACPLTSIDIPNSVISIGRMAFYFCKELTDVIIPSSVTSIGAEAFEYCKALTSVTISSGVTNIGNAAFACSSNLATITCEAVNPPALESYIFYQVDKSIPLYVPCEAIDAYTQAEQWSDFTNIYTIGYVDYSYSVTSADENQGTATITGEEIDCEKKKISFRADANEGYQFKQWNDGNTDNPRTIVLTQDTTLTAVFEQIVTGPIVIHNGENENLSNLDPAGTKFVEEIIIEPGGELNVDDAAIHIGTLVIEADGTNSGQVHHGTGGINADHIYLEYILNPCGEFASPNRWYAISVPFEVDIATGISRNCDDKTLVSGTDFLIKEYNGTLRALLGHGWSDRLDGSLNAGQFYMIGIDGTCNRWRFEKKAGQPFEGGTHVAYNEYNSNNNEDAGWNGFGNTMLEYMRLNMGLSGIGYAVTYDNCYGRFVTHLTADIHLCVGRPFFIQASSDGYFDFFFGGSPFYMPALRAQREADPLMHFTLSDEAQSTGIDHMYLTMHEDAQSSYTIGRDIARMTTDCKTATQLWSTMSDGTELSAHGIEFPDTETIVPLTLFAPKDGEYLVNMSSRAMSDYDVELLHNGAWVATFYDAQPVTLDLSAGTNSDYSLRISRRNIPTGIEDVQGDNVQSTKVIMNDHLYIFRAGHVYDAQGKKVK